MRTATLVLLCGLGACGQTKKSPTAASGVVKGSITTRRECDPPDPNDPNRQSSGRLDSSSPFVLNGVSFVCSPDGRWVVNGEVEAMKRAEERRISDLYWALITRVLTDAEMQEVRDLGMRLVTRDWVPYSPEDKRAELHAALLQQFRLREIAKERQK